jgi:uncharacterized membrane protein YcaP (DUF421 family)
VFNYADIFNFPPIESVALSVLQTATLFAFLLVGLKLIGRRVFAERSPQDLIIIVLVAEACDLGLTHEEAGYWGSFFSVITIFFLGYLTERISFLRRFFNPKPIYICRNGIMDEATLKKHMIDNEDLDEAARQHGLPSHKHFIDIVLEGDGRISGIYKVGKE